MVELATKVMTGTPLKELGFGTGLYKIPPYFAIKVPVFSFEKLSDINSELGPEMKSTGEVLGIGRTLNEALFKGLVSAGFKVGLESTYHDKKYNAGVLISVHDKDKPEIVGIAKKFADLGLKIYSTAKTGVGLRAAGIEVETIGDFNDCSAVLDVLETGKIDYIVYTGSTKQATIQNFIKIHRRAVQLSICTLTSLDTANALCDTLASRFTQRNTELVDINNLREEKMQLKFTKMQATGNDDIYFNNFCKVIPSPESLTVNFTDRHFGIGADGVVLLESSDIADAKMVVYNNDGTQTRMAVNSIRCAAKYLYDNGIVPKKNMTIETSSGVMKVKLYTFNGEVRSATVDIGKPDFNPASIPMNIDAENAIGYEAEIGGEKYTLNCVSVGNPHCIVFRDDIDSVNINEFGDMIRNSELLPEYINTGVARLIDKNTIKLRCYERAVNGESLSCGASAAACVVVATDLGKCKKGEDITVKMPGGDLVITYTDETILVNGDTHKVYEGVVEY
jgi:carbamoyl-phosphate synthase large subunit